MFYPCHAYEYLSLALLYNYSLSINLIRFLNFSSACFLFPMLSAFLFFRFNFFSFVISSYALFDSFFPFYFLSFVIIELLDILQTYSIAIHSHRHKAASVFILFIFQVVYDYIYWPF